MKADNLRTLWRRALRRFAPLRNSSPLVTAGFVFVLALMLVLVIAGAAQMRAIHARAQHTVERHSVEIDLLQSMRAVVHERSMSLYGMYLMDDPFAREDEYYRFTNMAVQFMALRRRFEENHVCREATTAEMQALCVRETETYRNILGLIRRSQPLQVGLVERIVRENTHGVREAILRQDQPLEREILVLFDRLIETKRGELDLAAIEAEQESRQVMGFALAMGASLLALGLAIALFVIRRARAMEHALYREKELAEVTLHSVGDGVITTDTGGNVAYLNPVAEQMTGWNGVEARGMPLSHIYRVVDDATRRPLEHPAMSLPLDGLVTSIARAPLLLGRDGREFAVDDSAAPIRSRNGEVVGTVVVFRDITQTRKMEKMLTWQATRDPLTGLANRRAFELILERLLTDSRERGKQHALLYLDLDQFKVVNDTCGHTAGDELLCQLADVMQPLIRDGDTLARIGGDEFGVLLEGCPIPQAERIAHKLREAVQDFRFLWEGRTFRVGVSIGVVGVAADSGRLSQVLSAADAACYIAKDKGRNRIWVHRTDDREISRHHGEMQWVERITRAFDEDRFTLHFQRILPLVSSGRDHEMREVLVRLRDEGGQLVPPMAFIPAAERYGLMVDIDRRVIRHAFRWLAQQGRPVSIAVNLSGQSLSDDNFLDYVVGQFSVAGVDPRNVCFEVTETAAIANWNRMLQLVTRLREHGCRFALDDFGSGMSSFGYLKNLPVDFIKIDGSFVRDMLDDRVDAAMVETINHLGHVMGLRTIAESVESERILARLRELGVDYAQGFGLHTPESLEALPVSA